MKKTPYNFFYLNESFSVPGAWFISVDYEKFECGLVKEGSWNVLPARVLGISYPDWLRFCRDEFHAIINGKNCLYIVPYFKDKAVALELTKLLNNRANLLYLSNYDSIDNKD